ncbi:tRNA (N(6)-L-threonylcarbamoyladenosine(37)-C(2))-methylthiotransferase MtaB [Ferroacidibacillus organovorans]|uniref:Threonylcarbamoyladenosine tRNA methylthiotransferase MtaB n=1 Tax=Ferroacidibacillus organovorans TaxID=1765683 RepID=A0A1V4EX89_9BACL|nr:tRNA (N(6)-L-threonylcarbamoyladenosine(37)-C(2))-methylthiotransferase MtaB [Ferroacidibacillus organovorans]OPG17462.1 tRNA (N(6)-L-threonylcarbamoyladenosine(37)-C(2))-methylthiotransferase MtaB [Ferroacidibacillus organovorans]
MKRPTVAFHTLGCKVNFYDTESLWHMFERAGYEQVDFHDEADVYLINTCTVTHEGDRKSRQMIRRAVRKNPDATVVVTGCYAQMAPGEVLGISGVDLVVGNQHRDQLLPWIEQVQRERTPFHTVSSMLPQKSFEDFDVPLFVNRTRASLKIEDGCNHFCTFCIIPHARGLVRSRKPESVLRQARRLVDAGYLEIVLTGIHTGGYGEDLDGYTLAHLVDDLARVEGLRRIRISSIEASEITDEFIDAIGRSDQVCRHLHIPLQAGDSAVLKRMNRHYTIEEYANKLEKVRRALPELAITSDMIVGFPGETDAAFEQSMTFVTEQGFAELHVFPYSRRKGTPAATFVDQVPDEVKAERVARMMEVSDKLRLSYARQFVGRSLEVIPEERVETPQGSMLVGHADNYMRVAFSGADHQIGTLVEVGVSEAGLEHSYGQALRTLIERPVALRADEEDLTRAGSDADPFAKAQGY